MQLFGLTIILCLATTFTLAFWAKRRPLYASDFARPISRPQPMRRMPLSHGTLLCGSESRRTYNTTALPMCNAASPLPEARIERI